MESRKLKWKTQDLVKNNMEFEGKQKLNFE